jgi:N-acetylneuraminic acid mutarotase
MKKYILPVLSVLLLNSICAHAWTQKDTIGGGARSSACGFAIGTAAYVATGLDSNSFKRSMWMYNPATDMWTQMSSLGNATGQGLERNVAMSFAIGNKAYIVGGQGSNPFFSDVWEWDAVTDTWAQKQSFAGGGRRAGVGFAINGKGYVGLGQSSTGLRNDLYEYNPSTNQWTAKANFPGTARRFPACFVINNVAYVGTGDDGAFKADMFAYDPATNQWTAKANFAGTARYSTVSFALFGKGYVGLGYDNTLQNTDDIWEYDPLSNSWMFKDNFPGSKRANATAVVTPNNKCYIGLGYDSLLRDDWWEFDPLIDGVNENASFAAAVTLFPNPASDFIRLDCSALPFVTDFTLTIYDAGGRSIESRNISSLSVVEISVAHLASGMYQIVLRNESNIITKQLVVKR